MNPAPDVTSPDLNSPSNHCLSLGFPGALPLQKDMVSRLINMSIEDQRACKDSVGDKGLHSLDIVGVVMGVMCLRVRRALLFHTHLHSNMTHSSFICVGKRMMLMTQ